MKTFKAGEVVESKLTSGMFGTILEECEDGLVEVRFDGDIKSVVIPASRLKVKLIGTTTSPFKSEYDDMEFKKGDYLEVDTKNYGTVRGAAMEDWKHFGYVTYSMLTDEGELLDLNSNYDNHTIIFRADIARGLTPKY